VNLKHSLSKNLNICDGDSLILGNGQTHFNSGIYIDSLVSNKGCDSIVTISLDVLPMSLSITAIDTVCRDEDFQFSVQLNHDTLKDPIVNWYWEFGDGIQIQGGPLMNYAYSSSGSFIPSLTVYSSIGCSASTFWSNINVIESPIADFSVGGIDIRTLQLLNLSQNLTSNSIYSWSFGDGSFSTEFSPSHMYSTSGFYDVVLEVLNTNGCSNSLQLLIEIPEDQLLYIPNSFTPNGDQLNDEFTVVGSGLEFYQIQVYDRWGGLIYESLDINSPWDGTSVNGADMNKGTYMFIIQIQYNGGLIKRYQGTVNLLR